MNFMTSEGARLLEEAKTDERTTKETLTELHKHNNRLNWNIFAMCPEIIDRTPDR
jgi:hypothetical protein